MPTNTSSPCSTVPAAHALPAGSPSASFRNLEKKHATGAFPPPKIQAPPVLLLILLACAFLLSPLAAQQQSGNFTYISDGSSITITNYTGSGGMVTIPGTIAGLPVRTIGDSAFQDKVTLTGVTIPNSVTSLGYSAFHGCAGLANVSLGNGITVIRDGAFHGCTKLAKITIPNSVSTIGVGVFDGCRSLTEAIIPHGVTSIGDYAFNDCTALASVTLPGSISDIGVFVFSGCTGLANIIFAEGTKVIGEGQFLSCTSLEKVTIPGSVISISDYAFAECSKLINVLFAGNAPSFFGSSVFADVAPGFVIHYKKEATGFASPTWKGYPASVLGAPAALTLEDWRKQHFGASATNAGIAADTADPDGDGFNNMLEYAAATNPRNAASAFRVQTVVKTATRYTAAFEAQAGRRYELQRLPHTLGAVWLTVAVREPQDTQGIVSLTDAAAPPTAALYRVRVAIP